MLRSLPIDHWLAIGSAIVDVRSPGEFARGHIPGALNLPLFTDAERAVVGTLYKQQGREHAMLEGLRIVGPKLAAIVEQARTIAPDGRIRVHCWRGGERSGSVAWLLDKAGFAEVITLKGGYKAFRTHVLEQLQRPLSLRVLGGFTGSGKTALLQQLRDAGQPVIDLEALANHNGSAFGAIGRTAQPTTEHFENLLYQALRHAGSERPVWVEDEGRMIGRVHVPDTLYRAIRESPLYFVDVPENERTEHLVADYGHAPKEQLAAAIGRIRKRMGPQHATAALQNLDAGDLHAVARLALHYYDRAYRHDLALRAPNKVHHIDAPDGAARLQCLLNHART